MAARRLGFDHAGVCPAVSPTGFNHLESWLASGYAGEMDYIPRRKGAYQHPSGVMDGVRSVMMLATNYCTSPQPDSLAKGRGRVSRYAWGQTDYHDLIWDRLTELERVAQELIPGCESRGIIDTAPLLEREFSKLAGLGWQAKNTMLINPQVGSWFFLSALLLDCDLEYDEAIQQDHCGTCTACLDACPTNAFVAPRVLDATRCISYLTIELKSQIPRELRSQMDDWVFGCDVCQEVCPWNRFSTPTDEPAFQPVDDGSIDLRAIFFWSDVAFRERFRATPLWRPRRRGILRNAAIVLGNQRSPDSIPALTAGIIDREPLVRGASAWALGEIGNERSKTILSECLERELDDEVRDEIQISLKQIDNLD